MKYLLIIVLFMLSACSPASLGLSMLSSGVSSAINNSSKQEAYEKILKERKEFLKCYNGIEVENMNAKQYNDYCKCTLSVTEYGVNK